MKDAFIVSTGTELLSGTTPDSNSVFLSTRLMEMGFRVIGKITVGDDHQQLRQAFKMGVESADIIISTGGLGPTFDDLTKIIACEVMNCELEERAEEVERLQEYFASRRRAMPEINLRQAMFPNQAVILQNHLGTAPGMYLNKDHKVIILLPGPPREMIPMYLSEVEPLLKEDFAALLPKVFRKNIKILGLGESQVEERLSEIMPGLGKCSIALLAAEGEIYIRLSMEESQAGDALAQLNDICSLIFNQLGRHVFGCDEETLVSKLGGLLRDSGLTLAVAESCTGGLLSKMITDTPGSSDYFWGGVISYSNEAKERYLGVNRETLENCGAVSPETAREMARGVLDASGADFALAITGVAGPDGGTEEKPVGLVYIGMAHGDECKVKELRLSGGRDLIRILAAKSALDLLRRKLEYK